MKQQGMTSGIAFAGNPIIFNLEELDGIKGGTFAVRFGGEIIYHGKFTLPVSLNLSELLNDRLPVATPPEMSGGECLVRQPGVVLDGENVLQLFVEYDDGGDEESLDIEVMRGGVPAYVYERLCGRNTDIFTERFLNPNVKFFLTERAFDKFIEIPETELYPLAFICPPGKSITVTTGNFITGTADKTGGLYWFSPEALRRKIFLDSNGEILVNEFDVKIEGAEKGMRVLITRGDLMREPVKILYRNSYGIPEIIAFDGTLSVAPASDGASSVIYMCYNPVTDDFDYYREKLDPEMQVKVNTGVVSCLNLHRLMEMLRSEEVTLMYAGQSLRMVPTGDIPEIGLRPYEPQSFELTFRPVEKGCDLYAALAPEEPDVLRIFSQEHNDKFN